MNKSTKCRHSFSELSPKEYFTKKRIVGLCFNFSILLFPFALLEDIHVMQGHHKCYVIWYNVWCHKCKNLLGFLIVYDKTKVQIIDWIDTKCISSHEVKDVYFIRGFTNFIFTISWLTLRPTIFLSWKCCLILCLLHIFKLTSDWILSYRQTHGWASAELPRNRVNVNLFLRHILDLSS